MKPSIIVHGGAWSIPDDLVDGHVRGCESAADAGFKELLAGASAMDAVVEAVATMEDDATFDAGVGSVLNQSGKVELDAIVMDGGNLRSGAVAALQRIRNPVRVARAVMDCTQYSMLAGEGALEFASSKGFEKCAEEDLLVGRELEDYREFIRTGVLRTREHFSGKGDTVGACAVDVEGHVACATSTGGIPRKLAGRVGDSPLVGCGAYANDEVGAASATGWGEQIMAVVLSKTALDIRSGLQDSCAACRNAVEHLNKRVGGLGGLIMVDREGAVGYHHNTPRMAFAFIEGTTGRKAAAISV
ncbi:MAG: isoaspartyl peptidase/L-asparaginase [Methanobacteriota archaeon]|nr:MAG: isoaspartyl peptidase/L-asparaginase [Euryarchaeota archaeon]